MKGYFSQLAHRTGLSFTSGPMPSVNATAAPAAAALREGPEAVTPLHTEEIAFTAPALTTPPSVSTRGNEDTAGRPSPGAIPSTESENLSVGTSVSSGVHANMPPTESTDVSHETVAQAKTDSLTEFPLRTFFEESRIRFTDSESKTDKPREHSAEKQSAAMESEVVLFSDEVSQVAQKSVPREIIDRVANFESPVRQYGKRDLLAQNRPGRGREAEVQEPFQRTNGAEQTEPALDETDQELIVHNYLKEVRAWVAATPAIDEIELEQSNWAEVQHSREALAREQETDVASFSQRDVTQEPAVQDLNLSIGSISIVIEEPKKDAPAPAPAPQRAEIAPARSASESTNLSRYYLRSW